MFIFNPTIENGCSFLVRVPVLHTYSLENPYINPWSGESISNYDNTAYEILNPKYYIIEKQSKVEKNLNINSQELLLSQFEEEKR